MSKARLTLKIIAGLGPSETIWDTTVCGFGVRRQRQIAVSRLSHMLTIAETWGLRPEDSNPRRKINRYAEFARERALTPRELERLGSALSSAESDGDLHEDWRTIACFKLLLFTGARLSEVLTLRWEWIDWTRGIARLPDSKTGRKNLVLPEPALDTL